MYIPIYIVTCSHHIPIISLWIGYSRKEAECVSACQHAGEAAKGVSVYSSEITMEPQEWDPEFLIGYENFWVERS